MSDVESYYNVKAPVYDRALESIYFRIYDAITYNYLEPYIPSNPTAFVLDAGGGTGKWAIRIARKGCNVALIDLSQEMLNVAKKKIHEEKLEGHVDIRKGDITKLDYANETFDLVFCEHTLFLFKEPHIVIKELVRVLKKNAPLIVSAQNRYVQALARLPETSPEPEILRKAVNILTGVEHDFMTPDKKVEIHSVTPGEFRTLLERNGLNVKKIVPKLVAFPLRFSVKYVMEKEHSEETFRRWLEFELALTEKEDALALGSHMQAIAYKS
jgi:ubiquinone/menaquinone biosynthesis C-methylase UbiE